mgnify:CR=1 FL=1
MMYTKALCPALVVLWAGRGWAGLPRGFPPSPARGRGPQLLWGGVWQPRAEGRAAATMGPVGRRGTGISGGGRGGRPLRVEEEAGCTP